MDVQRLNAWCWRGDGSWWLARARVKWEIEDEAQRRAYEAAGHGERSEADWAREGWHGGKCDPLEVCDFGGEGDLNPDTDHWAAA